MVWIVLLIVFIRDILESENGYLFFMQRCTLKTQIKKNLWVNFVANLKFDTKFYCNARQKNDYCRY